MYVSVNSANEIVGYIYNGRILRIKRYESHFDLAPYLVWGYCKRKLGFVYDIM